MTPSPTINGQTRPADPRLVELLRQALAQRSAATPAVPPETPPKKSWWRFGLWSSFRRRLGGNAPTFLALIVSTAMISGVYAYIQLGVAQGETRGEVGKLRSEVSRMRSQLVRRDEFTRQSLAAHALVKEVYVGTMEAAASRADWLDAQKVSLSEYLGSLKALKADIRDFKARIEFSESERAAVRPPVKADAPR